MSHISADDVRKVAQLARLDLPNEKVETYTEQLESILDYVGQLQSIDTKDVPPTTRAVEVVNVTRPDAIDPTAVREDILNQAPNREGDFYRVPKILAGRSRHPARSSQRVLSLLVLKVAVNYYLSSTPNTYLSVHECRKATDYSAQTLASILL